MRRHRLRFGTASHAAPRMELCAVKRMTAASRNNAGLRDGEPGPPGWRYETGHLSELSTLPGAGAPTTSRSTHWNPLTYQSARDGRQTLPQLVSALSRYSSTTSVAERRAEARVGAPQQSPEGSVSVGVLLVRDARPLEQRGRCHGVPSSSIVHHPSSTIQRSTSRVLAMRALASQGVHAPSIILHAPLIRQSRSQHLNFGHPHLST